MDGFSPTGLALGRLATPMAAPHRIGLVLPDLDAPVPIRPEVPDGFDLDALLEEARASARQSGFAAGHAAGLLKAREEAAERMAEMLSRIAGDTGRIAASAAAQVEADAEALAIMLGSALDAALPFAAARDASGQAGRAAAIMAASLTSGRRAACHVAPELVADVSALFGGRGIALPVLADPALAPGDARIAWDGGAIESVLAHRRQAITEVLSAFGLTTDKDDAA